MQPLPALENRKSALRELAASVDENFAGQQLAVQ
jgi:hypothetical protein